MDILRPGRKERAQLDKLQRQIETLRNEIEAAIAADAADVDLREHCRLAVERENRSDHRGSVFDHLRLSDAHARDQDFAGMSPLQNSRMPDLSWRSLFEFLGKDRSIERAFQAAKNGAKTPPGLANAPREEKLAELREQVRKLERDEERETLRLEEAEHVILRREDVNPEILLEVWAGHGAPAGSAAHAPGAD